MHVPIHFDEDWCTQLDEKIKQDGPWDDPDMFKLALEAEQNMLVTDFDSIQCLQHLPDLTLYPHQLEAARKVLNEMQGKAILADEVGLGKTIEAGLILKEYIVRGLVKKALILVPASLVIQWTKELNEKLKIRALDQKKEYMWQQCDILVASLDTAKRSPHREHVLEQNYDMIIIDEAHKLKNHHSKNYAFVTKLTSKYCLLLTATPIQNELSELYYMVSLLKPGLLNDPQTFTKHFTDGKRKTKNHAHLKTLLSKVMVRHMRKDSNIGTKRIVHNIELQLSPEERSLYDSVTHFAREVYASPSGHTSVFSMITLQREVCSSKEATFMTLYNMLQKCPDQSKHNAEIEQLLHKIKAVHMHTKAQKMLELVQQIKSKVIIFTEYKATQNYLQHILHQAGLTSVLFRGNYKRSKKDWMIDLFRTQAQVLIATEAGAEGINLQFCNHIINYDLPWNPMKVEQRIGRVHRLGQEQDVYIYNLTFRGTIEQYILHLLYEKIELFQMVIGQLEKILDKMQLNTSLEDHLAEIFMKSSSTKEIEIKMQNLSAYMQQVRQHVDHTQQHTEEKQLS